jgi:D-glycero-alpha-D-manno-heptose-7-phosphate kinase
MIISRTPFRISFFGGGTDYPAWYRKHGGAVLATTIDKYCYLTCRYLPPFFEHRFRLVYSKMENCKTIDEIEHPAVREVLRYLNIDRGMEIHHDADLPARSGMGSSSAFTVGLLHALRALTGHMRSKHQLAMESIELEQEILKETVGSQDQVSAAYGGFNYITFFPNGEISVRPMTIARERVKELNAHLMLFYTGIKRTASSVAESYVSEIDGKKRQLRLMRQLVDESLAILNSGQDITAFGELLHEAWQAKRSLSGQVSNAQVDDLYDRARAAGAIGGKLTGAGGGGFLLLFVPSDLQPQVREKLSNLIYVPFKFEYSGSQIIFYDAQEDYAEEEKARAK